MPTGVENSTPSTVADSDALMPRPVRRVVYAVTGLLMAFAGYLFLVRGSAIMFDLAQAAYAMFCM